LHFKNSQLIVRMVVFVGNTVGSLCFPGYEHPDIWKTILCLAK
jgi:hypothetical protein